MIPTRLAVLLLAAGAVASLVAGALPWWWAVLAAWDAAVIAAVVVDAMFLVRPGSIRARRRTDRILSIGQQSRFVLEVVNGTDRKVTLRLVEPLVAGMEPLTVDLGSVTLAAGERREIVWHARPLERGRFLLPPTSVRMTGPLGLGSRQMTAGEPMELKVYPDIASVGRYQALVRRSRLREMGIGAVRLRGHGTEFESLREYVPGDDPGRIDWKATARRGKLICRNYQAERSQSIMLLVDAGRMMTAEIGGLSRFDHAMNSALLLAHVALTRGDGVGLVVFSGKIDRYVPPRKGRGHLGRIVEAMHDVKPALDEPTWREAVARAAIARRRSLVVLFTDISARESAREMVPYVNRLLPRHLPLIVFLRDTQVEGLASGRTPEGEIPDPWAMAAAASMLDERDGVMELLRSKGSLVLDVVPGGLSPRVVNAYLDIKARHLI